MAVKRTYYKDRYNDDKVWEVVKLKGGYYLRQYICGEQFGKGLRTTKKFIRSLGILDFETVKGIKKEAVQNEYEDCIRSYGTSNALFQKESFQVHCAESQKEILPP